MKKLLFIATTLAWIALPLCAEDSLHFHKADGKGGTFEVQINGNNIQMKAVPNPGYSFYRWADDGTDYDKASRSLTYSGSGKITYRAIFTRNSDVSDVHGGTVAVAMLPGATPTYQLTSAPYTQGECASTFVGWSDGASSAQVTYQEGDGRLYPVFRSNKQAQYTISDINNGGTIQVTRLDCGFTLTAQPANGYMFTNWDNELGTNPILSVDFAEGAYKANFALQPCKIGDTYFTSLADAINAAGPSDIIVLQNNLAEDVVISKAVTIDGGNFTITGDLTITKEGKLTMSGSKTLSVSNLYLASEDGAGSQIINTANLTVSGDAFMDVTLRKNAAKADGSQWYAVAVPFEVTVNGGITRASSNDALTYGKDYLVRYYDGEARATTGTGWKDAKTETMQPGKFYLFGIDGTENVWRFKKSGTALEGAATQALAMTSATSGAEGAEAGWNAAGVSVLHNVYASATDISKVLMYNNTSNAYVAQTLKDYQFAVGTPFFVQVVENVTLNLSAEKPAGVAARKMANNSMEYEICLSNATFTDKLYLSAHDDAEDMYVIGRDLGKMRSNNVQQLWTTAYGISLCCEDKLLTDDAMDYTTTMYAPKAGTYTLTASEGDLPVSLWKNGAFVANLSGEPVEIYLSKGNNTGYTLRVGTIRTLSTQLEQLRMQNAQCTMKAIVNGQLVIVKDGKVFNAQGQEVK